MTVSHFKLFIHTTFKPQACSHYLFNILCKKETSLQKSLQDAQLSDDSVTSTSQVHVSAILLLFIIWNLQLYYIFTHYF